MFSAKRLLLIALTFTLALTVIVALAPRAAHAFVATMVQVVNTAANPVPITGRVDASDSNVNIANTPNVNLANAPTVNLASGTTIGLTGNDASNPIIQRDVDNPARHPFVAGCSTVTQYDSQSSCVFAAPAGHRLVIEQVSADARYYGSLTLHKVVVTAYIKGSEGFQSFQYFVAPVDSHGTNRGVSSSTVNLKTRIYADPNANIYVTFYHQDGSMFHEAYAYISGYLVDM